MQDVKAGMRIGQDMRAHRGRLWLLRAGTVLTRELILLMIKRGIESVYIEDESDRERYRRPRFDHGDEKTRPEEATLSRVIKPPTTAKGVAYPAEAPPPPEASINHQLRDDVVSSLDDIFKDAAIGAEDVHASTAAVVKKLDNVVDSLVGALDGQSVVNIMNIKSYDDYTYHH